MIQELFDIVDKCKQDHRYMILSGVQENVLCQMERHHFIECIGGDCFC